MLESGFGESRLASVFRVVSERSVELRSMRAQQVRRPVSDTAETVLSFAAETNSVSRRKILVRALTALFVAVAVPLLFRPDLQLAAVNGALKCYDSDGKTEPCVTQASAALSRFNGRATRLHRPATWMTTALYRPESWETNAVDQPANSTGAAPARRSGSPRKRLASACGRHVLPCFFSALRRGVTHFASAAASAAQARPGRERL